VRRATALALAAALVLSLAGCRLHTDFTVREAHDSPVTFELLSGDGRFVVVQATAAGATVPGAGWWRVDREDGSTDQLPAEATRISADGARVLLADGSLWDEGSVTPGSATYSDDLTYRTFLSGGTVASQEVATGATVDVEAGHPRPVGTTGATPISISDDGQTVRYRLSRPEGDIDRIVRLGQPTVLDLPAPIVFGPTHIDHRVAAGGAAVVTTTEEWSTVDIDGLFLLDVVVGVTVELRAIPSGTVTATWTASYEPSSRSWTVLGRPEISEDGRWVWITQASVILDSTRCSPFTTLYATCVVQNDLTAVAAGRTRTTSLGGGDLTSLDITPDGLLAVTNRSFMVTEPRPWTSEPQITHAIHGPWETLEKGPEVTSGDIQICYRYGDGPPPCTVRVYGAGTQIADDGKVLASRSLLGAGWYDHVDPPEPPA
jgi:hypothetical protein